MEQKFYKKASVQAAIVGGFFLLIGIAIPNMLQIPELNDKIDKLKDENSMKDFKIQNLETEIAPFKTIALERFTGTEAEALSKLSFQLSNLGNAIADIKKYDYISKFNAHGLDLQIDSPLTYSTPISRMLKDVIEEDKSTNGISYKCDDASLDKYKQVINLDQNFPFSYYFLALCYKQRGDNSTANDYSKKAFDILKVTTTIAGHNQNHDEALKDLERIFSNILTK